MKKLFKILLKYYLKYITKITIIINKPLIIGITGSTNKTFTRDDVKKKLESRGISVRSHKKSFNTEIGLPLAILGLKSGYNSYIAWLPIILEAFLAIFKKTPKILLLEYGVSKPGDMKYLLSIAKPNIGIITDITKRYLENFSGIDDLTSEYQLYTKKLNKKSFLIANNDNTKIVDLIKECEGKVISFGKEKGSNFLINSITKLNNGTETNYTYEGLTSEFIINKFGQHNVYSYIGAIIATEYATK